MMRLQNGSGEGSKTSTRMVRRPFLPPYLWHPSFEKRGADDAYDPLKAPTRSCEQAIGHLPDDETRDIIRRMHFAGFSADAASAARRREEWIQTYFSLRDRVVLGNRKLIFRAIQKSPFARQLADDLIGECDIIMIHAVAAFNPWLGIRFSTYAFTCLIRGLSRSSRRAAARRLINFLPLDAATEDAMHAMNDEIPFDEVKNIEELLRRRGLLTRREKLVLRRRFGLNDSGHRSTLETLGRDLGISKERVRQVQHSALFKLKGALGADEETL